MFMEALIKAITDFKAMQKFVEENEGTLIELVKKYYYNLGEEFGFESVFDYETNNNLCISLVWIDANEVFVAFEFAFGNNEEALAKIAKLALLNAELAVLISSSKALSIDMKFISNAARKLFSGRLILMDIAEERSFAIFK